MNQNEILVARPVYNNERQIVDYIKIPVNTAIAEEQLSKPREKRNSHWRDVKSLGDLEKEQEILKANVLSSLSDEELQKQLSERQKQKTK